VVLRPPMHAEDDRSLADRHVVQRDAVHGGPLVTKRNHLFLLSRKVCFVRRHIAYRLDRTQNVNDDGRISRAREMRPT
jgi:hypothetical protein